MQNNSSGPLVAHDVLILGSGESINQTSITATSMVSETAIQSEIPSESVALVPSWTGLLLGEKGKSPSPAF